MGGEGPAPTLQVKAGPLGPELPIPEKRCDFLHILSQAALISLF